MDTGGKGISGDCDMSKIRAMPLQSLRRGAVPALSSVGGAALRGESPPKRLSSGRILMQIHYNFGTAIQG